MSTPNTLPIVLKGEHWTVSVISLNAFTDDIDTLVHKNVFHLYRGKIVEKMEGNIFFLENEHDGNAYVILADCADYETAVLTVRDHTVSIEAGTNPVTVVPCKKGECEEACRRAYREGMGGKSLVAMENTWGDCNKDSRVCEAFVMKEIDSAAQLGIDIVQIDDGWQWKYTYDPANMVNGKRRFSDDFWFIHEERFPNGLKYISDYAAKKGVKLGIWFAPESRDHFVCMERDLKILKNAYDNWGVRFFKLDMYYIENDIDRDLFVQYLAAIYAFGDDVAVQIDVTRDARINYLCGRKYGTIFVENRYTKTGCFFPHRTLKNLWMLSRYIPASRFQFEVINPDLNADRYDPDDDFAPHHYEAEYLFASVMLSNPLFWMETQFLSEKSREGLKKIVAFWKSHRDLFTECDAAPIGEMPCGRSFTGFYLKHGEEEYALIFREAAEKNVGIFTLPSEKTGAEVLLSNADVKVQLDSGVLKAEFSKQRAYAFVKLK